MKKNLLLSFLIFTACIHVPQSNCGNATLAPTPPLGWNSFDSYGVYLPQEAAIKNIEAFAEKLKPHGYEYFVIDLGWYGEYKLIPGTPYPDEKHASDVALDEFGLYEPCETYFSNGLKPVIDKAHASGIKIGLHLMRGIPRKAVRLNLPIKGTSYTGRDIADTSSICPWCHHNYGVNLSKPGAQAWYNSVFDKLAEWKIDFVKVDDVIPYPEEIIAIAKAIEQCGRPMVYSLSPGGTTNALDWPYYRKAHLVRTTADIWDRRSDIDKAFLAWKKFQSREYSGFWPDLDMIPFGQLQLMQPAEYEGKKREVRLSGHGNKRWCRLTQDQMRTFITIRSLAASPLFMGGDLVSIDDFSLSLITNPHMLACNQNGVMGVQTYEKNAVEVWNVRKKDDPGKGWIGIFNRHKSQIQTVTLSKNELGLFETVQHDFKNHPADYLLRRIWQPGKTVLHDLYSTAIPPDGVVFLRYERITN